MSLLLRCLLLWLLLCCCLPLLQAGYHALAPASHNLTAYMHVRQKRHQLVFENGGTIRLLVGPVLPILLDDKVSWRGLLCFYLLYFGQYTLPTAPLYPWDKWEDIFARSLQQQISTLNETHEDDTRLFAYAALEHYVDGSQPHGGHVGLGRQCLLRAICENAQVHQHVGIMAELLNVLLTPGKTRLDAAYEHAYAAGLAGVDCLAQFAACPRGQSVLDTLIVDVEHY